MADTNTQLTKRIILENQQDLYAFSHILCDDEKIASILIDKSFVALSLERKDQIIDGSYIKSPITLKIELLKNIFKISNLQNVDVENASEEPFYNMKKMNRAFLFLKNMTTFQIDEIENILDLMPGEGHTLYSKILGSLQ